MRERAKRRRKRQRRQAIRRWAALCTVILTVAFIGGTADIKAAKNAFFHSEAAMRRILELELGKVEEDGLDGWTELAILPSPTLSGEKEAVSDYLKEQDVMMTEESVTAEEADQSPQQEEATEDEPQEEAAEEAPDPSPDQSDEEAAETMTLDLSGISPDSIEIVNHTEGKNTSVEKYWKRTPDITLQSAEEGPQILIMHTHATEAYRMADGDDYTESDESRTTDEHYNMIRIGEEMKAVFEENGFSVVHDKSTYDYPSYNGSYGRSLAGVQSYLDKYPTIQMVLDVHRDALIDEKGQIYSKTTVIDGEEIAQVMLVVGSNDGGLTHPDWRENYTLALKIQGAMLSLDKSFPRPIDLRSQRFNQHLRHGSLLVEVGTSGNTLQQAIRGAKRFALATSMELRGFESEE